ncbi:MAG: phage tail assembly protein [Gammaproteobacteria bacterium]
MTLQTEFNFTLPRGYVDAEGNLHKQGVMRMATAFDEIAPMKDPRVQSNPGYLAVILLSRVVIELGDLQQVNPRVIENLFSADFAFLEDLYRRINDQGTNRVIVTCPHCEAKFDVDFGGDLGES